MYDNSFSGRGSRKGGQQSFQRRDRVAGRAPARRPASPGEVVAQLQEKVRKLEAALRGGGRGRGGSPGRGGRQARGDDRQRFGDDDRDFGGGAPGARRIGYRF